MSRLQEIKDEIAKERGYENWFDLKISKVYRDTIELIQDEASKIYAKECSQASLEKASEMFWSRCELTAKESIKHTDNIVLL